MSALIQEKITQALDLLNEFGIDLWLTWVRETAAGGDPVLPLIFGDADLTWHSALLLTRTGERIAIVGHFDAEGVESTGGYSTVIPYHQSIQPPLLETLHRLNPQQIALNFSENDVMADGLRYGMYQTLLRYLEGTSFGQRFISAEKAIGALRSRKTSEEITRIRAAIETTQVIYDRTFQYAQAGLTEQEIAHFMQSQVAERGLETAWSLSDCPIVNTGPESPTGHVAPTSLQIQPGHILHLDFGVRQEGYCSDIQRDVYFLAPGETRPPEAVQRAFDTVVQAIQTAVAFMKPGVLGKEVDAVARRFVMEAGYPEYMHATGHNLGRNAHDGGAVLGPEWERYGNTPHLPLEPGQVYAVELGIEVPGHGYIGLEENVLVTDTRAEFLSQPQVDWVVR